MQGLAAANAKSVTPFTTAGRVEQVGTWWCWNREAVDGESLCSSKTPYIGMEKFALTNLTNTNKPREWPSSSANGIRQWDAWKRRDGSCWPGAGLGRSRPPLPELRELRTSLCGKARQQGLLLRQRHVLALATAGRLGLEPFDPAVVKRHVRAVHGAQRNAHRFRDRATACFTALCVGGSSPRWTKFKQTEEFRAIRHKYFPQSLAVISGVGGRRHRRHNPHGNPGPRSDVGDATLPSPLQATDRFAGSGHRGRKLCLRASERDGRFPLTRLNGQDHPQCCDPQGGKR
jgi:hypothetical protein